MSFPSQNYRFNFATAFAKVTKQQTLAVSQKFGRCGLLPAIRRSSDKGLLSKGCLNGQYTNARLEIRIWVDGQYQPRHLCGMLKNKALIHTTC